ncbi:MAG: SymE family type I addiction module toxin [Dyadobacter sp.]|uniref:SymE family type I addiction module toxin n=1 Tax=Dyadobacter sp. TaxID=1914288 RepID=UPI00326552B0
MRTAKPKTAPNPAKPNRPEVRSLKIQPKVRRNFYKETFVPEIKLAGEWLRNLGFESGSHVKITTRQELLIIQLLK